MINAGAVFTVAVVLWICASVSSKGQLLSQTVAEWDDALGTPYEFTSNPSHKNNVATAKYRTGDIFLEVRYKDGVAEGVKMHFHMFGFDGTVAQIQRNVLNQTFQILDEKSVAGIWASDWYQDGVLHYTVKNDFGHHIATFRIERDTITMVMSNCHGYFDIER